MILNQPDVVQTLTRLHDEYERALADNDVEVLTGYFWDSPHVVRYGVAEQLYGAEDLHAYRQRQSPLFTERRLTRREITAFGDSCATVMCEISLVIAGVPRTVRQSQTWIRFHDTGWRVVAAHVSRPLTVALPWEGYVDAMARALGVSIDADARVGTIANLERIAATAATFLAVPLPDGEEPAPVFEAW